MCLCGLWFVCGVACVCLACVVCVCVGGGGCVVCVICGLYVYTCTFVVHVGGIIMCVVYISYEVCAWCALCVYVSCVRGVCAWRNG